MTGATAKKRDSSENIQALQGYLNKKLVLETRIRAQFEPNLSAHIPGEPAYTLRVDENVDAANNIKQGDELSTFANDLKRIFSFNGREGDGLWKDDVAVSIPFIDSIRMNASMSGYHKLGVYLNPNIDTPAAKALAQAREKDAVLFNPNEGKEAVEWGEKLLKGLGLGSLPDDRSR